MGMTDQRDGPQAAAVVSGDEVNTCTIRQAQTQTPDDGPGVICGTPRCGLRARGVGLMSAVISARFL